MLASSLSPPRVIAPFDVGTFFSPFDAPFGHVNLAVVPQQHDLVLYGELAGSPIGRALVRQRDYLSREQAALQQRASKELHRANVEQCNVQVRLADYSMRVPLLRVLGDNLSTNCSIPLSAF